VIYTLQPWLVSIEQSLRRALLLPRGRRATCHLNMRWTGCCGAILRRATLGYAIGRQWGWLSVNDMCGGWRI
jgi:hypothetical protein